MSHSGSFQPNSSSQKTQYKFVKKWTMALFLASLVVYTLTRLICLPDFPIYFFTDEAIQTQHAADLIANGFRSPDGVFLPTYFENGGQYNLSLSVYIQVIPTLLFGKSIWVTRGTSVLLTLIGAIFLSLILRNHLESKYWWLGPLVLSITPTWFLHSRTAFETVLMTSMYAGFLYFYLQYRQEKPGNLYPALVFGALAFYAYSPGQVIVVLTGLLLLISDARYHWGHRKTALKGLALLVVLALPYLRFTLNHQNELTQHLSLLNSYWVKDIPLTDKIFTYLTNYLKGFNPFYWFWPRPSLIEQIWPNINLPTWLFSNQLDLDRHTMKGYGHILWVTFPFFITGLIQAIKNVRDSEYRVLVLAMIAAPSGAAIVDWGITRGMVFVIPAVIFTVIGFAKFLNWINSKWQVTFKLLSVSAFLILTLASFWMLTDALINGPTWYHDYGLSGMQYGAKQVFTRAAEIARFDPNTTVLVSSTWANGTDVLMRYFADDLSNLQMGNINAYGFDYKPLSRDILFIMTEDDLTWIEESGKFTNISTEETISYPDDTRGFYFVRLEYVPNIKEILEEERKERQALLLDEITWQGEAVRVAYPTLDINEIQCAFDGDPLTLIRTLEVNPLRLVIKFPEPKSMNTVSLRIGGTPTDITIRGVLGEKHLSVKEILVERSTEIRDISLHFDQTLIVDTLEIEIYNPHDSEIAHVHLWEVSYE
jgi:hypothetical protein